MHGDFLAEQIDERLVGGVSLLSGYVKSSDNKDFWIIDEEAAGVVRLIFRLFLWKCQEMCSREIPKI